MAPFPSFSAPKQTIRIPTFQSPTAQNKSKAPQTREEERAARFKSGNQQWQSLDAFAAAEAPASLSSLLAKRVQPTPAQPHATRRSPVRQGPRASFADPTKPSVAERRQSQAIAKKPLSPPRQTTASDTSSRDEVMAPAAKRARVSSTAAVVAPASLSEKENEVQQLVAPSATVEERPRNSSVRRPSLAGTGAPRLNFGQAAVAAAPGGVPAVAFPSSRSRQPRASSSATALGRLSEPSLPAADPGSLPPDEALEAAPSASPVALPVPHPPSVPSSVPTPPPAKPIAGPSRHGRTAPAKLSVEDDPAAGSVAVGPDNAERGPQEKAVMRVERKAGGKKRSLSPATPPSASTENLGPDVPEKKGTKSSSTAARMKGKRADKKEKGKARAVETYSEIAEQREEQGTLLRREKLRTKGWNLEQREAEEDKEAKPDHPVAGPSQPHERHRRLSTPPPLFDSEAALPPSSPPPARAAKKRRRSKQESEQEGSRGEKQVRILTERLKSNKGRLNVFDVVAGGAKKLLDRLGEDASEPHTLKALQRFSRSFRSSFVLRSALLTSLSSSHNRVSTAKTRAKKLRMELLDVQQERSAVQARVVKAEQEWREEQKEAETVSTMHTFLTDLQTAAVSWR